MILLKDIWPIENVRDYKVHFGRWNGDVNPLDEWVLNRQQWDRWQEYKKRTDYFNREFIFSLMQFYTEPNTWIFGGIYRVKGRYEDRYDVELTEDGKAFIGRLKLWSDYKRRSTRVNFENHYHRFKVLEIFREPYFGQTFPGYEAIDISFKELEALIQNVRSDWKSPLENVKGIYMITDIKTGKRYVGSAYGDNGIWGRWTEYSRSGHGGNIDLRKLIGRKGSEFARERFRFTLLEYKPFHTSNGIILKREAFWKEALLTRKGPHGYNRN